MTAPAGIPSPLDFFSHLQWLDGRPLPDVIEKYRAKIFTEAMYSFDDDGRPKYNLVLAGRAKKNWKTTDLILGALYRFLIWPSPMGNDIYLLCNDEDQANDDLQLAKKLIAANTILGREVQVQAKQIVRRDGAGRLQILPAGDVRGSHGKTYLGVFYDEVHGYRSWDLFEALAPDPTRPDAMVWVTSYASLYNSPGAPLYDMFTAGKAGDDARMFFSWYSADYTTDPDFAEAEPEQRANPSLACFEPDYLDQQRRRLPTHRYRRLHLNLPGMPEGAALDADAVMQAIVKGRKRLSPEPDVNYRAFVDMSGGSGDDATLAIAHRDEGTERVVLDLLVSQSGRPPFNPRRAVEKFAAILREYGLATVTGDAYAGQTFRRDFEERGISYEPCGAPKASLYEECEPALNAGELELLDLPKLQEQLLGLVHRGARIDHQPGEHDDFANSAAGVVWLLRLRPEREISIRDWSGPAEGARQRLSVGRGLSPYTGSTSFDTWARGG